MTEETLGTRHSLWATRGLKALCVDLPIMEYTEAWNLQGRLVAARRDSDIDTDIILLLEHPPVFTLGRRGGRENLTVSNDFLKKAGIPVIQVERGGNITFHGPGQLVMYPIIDLRGGRLGVTDYVTALEEVMIRVAGDWGVRAERNSLNRGVWVGNKKLGSVGIAVRRGVCFHGIALNVNLSLRPFDWINPCGLEGVRVTSMEREVSPHVSMSQVREAAKRHFETVFQVELVPTSPAELQSVLEDKTPINRINSRRVEAQPRKPSWLKRTLPKGRAYEGVRELLHKSQLHTVCEEAKCPNIWECFSQHISTFLIMGPRCTRNCLFCAVAHGPSGPPDPEEPSRVAGVAQRMGLRYVVITSVTRDDLPDGGAGHFAKTIAEIRKRMPNALVEILIPDFQGNRDALQAVVEAHPDVLNHNIETVSRLYPLVRPGAGYRRSLELLALATHLDSTIPIKSGLMLGLGESSEEIDRTIRDLCDVGCSILTLGQYLQPTGEHLPVKRFIPPEEFDQWRRIALRMGFSEVASGPFVRSSYHARELYHKCGQNLP